MQSIASAKGTYPGKNRSIRVLQNLFILGNNSVAADIMERFYYALQISSAIIYHSDHNNHALLFGLEPC